MKNQNPIPGILGEAPELPEPAITYLKSERKCFKSSFKNKKHKKPFKKNLRNK